MSGQEEVKDGVLCEQQLKDQLASGSLSEQRNMARARLAECKRLGGWILGASQVKTQPLGPLLEPERAAAPGATYLEMSTEVLDVAL